MDFLRGRPAANLARFALPALGANLLQSADQVVDMLVVGAFVGERGLAALANATMVGFVANSLSLGLSVGATVLVSRRLGAGDPPRRLPCGGDGAPRGNRALGRRRAALRGPRRPALRRTRRPGRRARGRRGVHACLGGGAARRLPALR
ncbi:MATE family efflux transporter, partial [Collinsella aerofaciens]